MSPLPACRSVAPAMVSVHLESTRSSTSSTGSPAGTPSTAKAPQTFANCWCEFSSYI